MSVTYQHGLFVVSDMFRKLHPEALDLIYKHNNEKKIAVLNRKLFSQHEYFLDFEQKIINMLSSLKGYKFIKHTTYAFLKEEVESVHITGPRIFPPYSKHVVSDTSGREYFSDIDTVSCPKCSEQTTSKVLWGQDLKALSGPITDSPKREIKLEERDEKLLTRLRTIIATLRDLRTSCLPSTLSQVLQPEDCSEELKVVIRKLDSATTEVKQRLESLHWDISNISKVKLDELDGQMDAKDMSVTPAINTDATQSVELINQAPSQENKDPIDYGVRHAITEQEMDTFEQMANRWFPLQQLVWSTQANGTVLFDENFPSYAFTIPDFLESPNSAIFRNYRFFRFDVEFEVQINSSKMQAGALLCSWRYLDQYDEVRNIGDTGDRFLRTQGPHSFAYCGRNSIAKLHIPYKHFFPVLAANTAEDFNIRDFFRLNILVFNYLRGGDNCNDPVTVNIQMRFINMKKSGLFNSMGIMRGQFDDRDTSDEFSLLCKDYDHHVRSLSDPDLFNKRLLSINKASGKYPFFSVFYATYHPLPIGRRYYRFIKRFYNKFVSLLKSDEPAYQECFEAFYGALRQVLNDPLARCKIREYIEKRFNFQNLSEVTRYYHDRSAQFNESFENFADLPQPIDLLHGEDPKTIEEFVEIVRARSLDRDIEMDGQMGLDKDILGLDLKGGIRGALKGGVEGLLNQDNSDSNRDKPSDPNQFPAFIPYASHSWAHGDGVEKTNILRLQPTGQTPHFQPTDEMTVKNLTTIFSGIETFVYRTTDAEGTRIASYYVNPVAQARERIIQPADENTNQLATYRVPSIGVVSSNFAYWKGSIEFRFDFIVPFTNTGRVMIAYIPTYMLDASLADLNDGITYRLAKSCYNAIFDLGEETSITFKAPFYTDRAWLKTNPSNLEISGVVAIFVVNRLVRFCTSSSIVDVNTFVRAGDDFELAIPIKPFLSPSFNRSYIPPTTQYRTLNGEGNPAFAGLGDPASYQENVGGEVYGPVIARDGGSWSNWATIRPMTNVSSGDVFEFGQSKTIEWTQSTGVNYSFRYGVPLLNNNGVLGDSPALALFQTQEGAREFAQFQVANGTYKQGPYTRYYYTRNSPGQRDTDGPPSSVVSGTILDLLDVEQTGQMDDRRLTSIYSTPGEQTTHSSQEFFNERFNDLKTISRRYQFYADFDSILNANTCFGQVIARIPIRPIIQPSMNTDTCAARLFNAVRGGFIANIGSGFRFFKGSLRFKFIFNVTFTDPSSKNENEDLTFMITHVPELGAPSEIVEPSSDLPTSYNPQGYAYYGHSTRVNPICEIEIPYYSRYEYITPYRINTQNDLDNLGYIDISLGGTVNKSVKLAMQVYYSFGDDARFSSFQGFPSMVYLGDIPQNPQQATQAVNAQTGQMNSLMKGATSNMMSQIDETLKDFSKNLTTSLQSNVDNLLSHSELLVGKAGEIFENKMTKQQENFFEHAGKASENIASNLQQTMTKQQDQFFESLNSTSRDFTDNLKKAADGIVQNSLKQCMEMAEGMGLKNFGVNWMERLANIVFSVGHILIHPDWKTSILSLVQILVNLGLILADKITDTFQSLVSLVKPKEKGEQDGQFEGMEAMASTFATVILSAAGLTLGKGKNKAMSYASTGLRLFKDFSLASNSFSTWIKNNLAWISGFLKWANLSNDKMELNSEIVEKYDSLKEWLVETHRLIQLPIHRIESDFNMILKVYSLAWKAESYMTMECADVKKIPIHHNIRHLSTEICKLRDQLLSSSFSPPIGVEPFVICLAGPPGFGKSELLGVLSDKLISDIGFKCSGNTSYVRGFTPYWNNAGNQPNVIIDEVGANEETMKQFVTELFSMKSRSVFNPDFAHLEDKRRVFNPISIIMGTNFPFWDVIPTGANSLTALHRRRDALWEVMPNFPGTKDTPTQMAAMAKKKREFMRSDRTELDFSHLKFRLCVNPEAETYSASKWYKWISYEEFYRVNLSLFKLHRLKEVKLIKAALDRAYKQRMSFFEGNEEETNGLQDFYDKIMTAPKQDLFAKLGTFHDPSLTATVGSVKVNEDNYSDLIDKEYQKHQDEKDMMEGQQKKDKHDKSNVTNVKQLKEGEQEEEKVVHGPPDIPLNQQNNFFIEKSKRVQKFKNSFELTKCQVRDPVDGDETVHDDPRFESLLYDYVDHPLEEKKKQMSKEEKIYLQEHEVSKECVHQKYSKAEKDHVIVDFAFGSEEASFLMYPSFGEETRASVKSCGSNCYFKTMKGSQNRSYWLKKDKEIYNKYKSSKKQGDEEIIKENLKLGKKSLLATFKDYFTNFNSKWLAIGKVIGWISLCGAIIGAGVYLYKRYNPPKQIGNMKIDDIQETMRLLNEMDKIRKSPEFKEMQKNDPDAAQAIIRQLMVKAQIIPQEGEAGSTFSSGDSSVYSNQTRSSYNSLKRMSAAYRRYEEQGGQSEQLESLTSLIQGNLARIVTIVNGSERCGTNTCGLYNKSAFLLRHQVKTLQALKEKGVSVQCFIERNIPEQGLKRYEFFIDDVKFDENSKDELILFKFPKSMPSFKNIIRHIASERTVVPSSCLMTWMDKKGRIVKQIVQTGRSNYTQCISSSEIVPYKLYYDEAISYNFGGSGLCGTPLISISSAPKILGFHCGGLGEKQGSSQRVYQSNFSVDIEGQYYVAEDDLCDDPPMVKLPPNLKVLGIMKKDKMPGFSTKSQLKKSLLFNEIYESKKIPAPLKKINGVDPMEKALEKLQDVPTGFDKKLLKMAYESLRDDLIFQCPPLLVPEETSRLTLEQCFSGIPGYTEYKKINLGSSEGYPLNILGKDPENRYYFGDNKLTTGKHWLFDYDLNGDGYTLNDIHPLLLTERERMNNQRAAIINGIDLGERQYAVLTLKDQKMDIEKAILGKNRIFSACPVEQSLIVREYFGHWKASYMSNRIDNSTAIGIDVGGPEWTRLAIKLLEKGNNIITGDYKAFGDTLDKDCVREAFRAINDWYDFNYPNQEQENLMRGALYDELIRMPHIAKNVIFQRQNGIPSGFGLTVELNDLVNKLYMKLAWLSITKVSLREMAQHVYYCMYGDDLIMSVSDKYIDLFNFESIQDFLFQHNITFTPATKDEFSYKSLPLSQSTFLKGNFVEHPSSKPLRPIYMCRLPESSILELLNWQWKDNDPKTFCFVACRAALQTLFTHGRNRFDEIRKKMLKFFSKNRNTLFGPDDQPDLQTFDELEDNFLKQFTD